MITTKTVVRLTANVANLCPHRWQPTSRFAVRCVASGDAHLCVGDTHHRGKHVCPCGASTRVMP